MSKTITKKINFFSKGKKKKTIAPNTTDFQNKVSIKNNVFILGTIPVIFSGTKQIEKAVCEVYISGSSINGSNQRSRDKE